MPDLKYQDSFLFPAVWIKVAMKQIIHKIKIFVFTQNNMSIQRKYIKMSIFSRAPWFNE